MRRSKKRKLMRKARAIHATPRTPAVKEYTRRKMEEVIADGLILGMDPQGTTRASASLLCMDGATCTTLLTVEPEPTETAEQAVGRVLDYMAEMDRKRAEANARLSPWARLVWEWFKNNRLRFLTDGEAIEIKPAGVGTTDQFLNPFKF